MRRQFRWVGLAAAVFFLAFESPQQLFSQVAPSAISGPAAGAFVSFGGQGTHMIADNFNSLGVDGGFYIQHSTFIGFEARFADYSMFARYSQAPFTAGYRVGLRKPPSHRFQPFAYAGAGMSHSVNATAHYVALPASWQPCAQVSQGLNIPMRRHWQWKAYEGTWTETFGSERNLRSLTLTTGIVYTFRY